MTILNDIEFSSSAPDYAPDTWNDLNVDTKENVRHFFAELRERHMGSMTLLQSSSILYLGALVSLFDKEENYPNRNASRIKNLIPPDEVDAIKNLIKKYFSFQQTRANCYAYMLDFRDGFPGCKPDPGGKTQEYKCGLYQSYRDAVVAGAVEDELIHAGSTMPAVRSDFYRAALFIKESRNDPSFHWVREDFNAGCWSHKDGHGPVKNLDYKGNAITNPQHASMGDYELAAYFYV
ncbi:MAG: hypothetical protein AAB276_02850, partial [Pseudomonadota bacterium]